jgi:thiol reductant ABC exporter CydC subunit
VIALIRLVGVSWWRFAIAMALGVVAVLAGAGLLGLSGYLICRAAQQPAILSLGALMVGVRVLALLRPGARYGERLSGHDLAFRALGRLRTSVYARIEPLAPAGLEQFRRGELLSRMVSDVEELQDLVLRVMLPIGIALPASLLIVVGVGMADANAAAILAIGMTGALTFPPFMAYRTTARSGRQQAVLRAALTADLVETLGAAEELWLNGADQAAQIRLGGHDDALVRAASRDARAAGVADALGLAIAGFTTAAVLVATAGAARRHALDPLLVAPLVLVSLAAFEVAAPLSVAARRLPSLLTAGKRVLALIDRDADVADQADARRAGRRPDIDLHGVDVSRGRDHEPVLENLDFHLAPGERIVVTGPSGAGKTTLLQFLVRFLERTGGEAELDGEDLRHYRQDDVRRELLLLNQDPHVFNSDLRENVLLARPGATDADVFEALDRARLGAWARSLPDGLDTRVGEAGRTLSGGQRQRLAMARAFLADPSVLLLDEPTAHLDAQNAAGLLGDLWSEAGDRSVILVTHGHRGPFTSSRSVHLDQHGVTMHPTDTLTSLRKT